MTSEQEWFGHEVEPKEEDWPINIKFRDGHIELWNILSRHIAWEDRTNIEAWTPVPKYTPPEQEIPRMFLSGKEIEFVKHSPFQWGIRWDSARFHFSYDLYFPTKAAAHKAIDTLLRSYRVERSTELSESESADFDAIQEDGDTDEAQYVKNAEKIEKALEPIESELRESADYSNAWNWVIPDLSIDEYQAMQEQLTSAEEAITKVLYWEKNAHLFVFNLGPLRAHRVRYPALEMQQERRKDDD